MPSSRPRARTGPTAELRRRASCKALAEMPMGEIRGTRDQVKQARALLGDAVHGLNRAFGELSRDADAQRHRVKQLLLDMSGELEDGSQALNIQTFVQQTGELLSGFADLLAHFSKQSITIAYRIDDMVDEMAQIFRLVEQVDAIAEDTNILAINAALEAVRAGDRGKGFGVVASEVRALSRKTKGLNDTIVDRMKDAEESISSVREAIGTMASQDMTVTLSAKASLDVMLGKLDRMQDGISATLQDIETYTNRVDASASDVIRQLQFEDLVTQILQSIDERIERVEDTFDTLRRIASDTSKPSDTRVRAMQDAIEAYAEMTKNSRRPAVEQVDLAGG
ncbi:MAG: hypothetical protein HC923_00435, partial [Myxococcales bacterium]|nr:hypothetical protein [Myxococcales bacterium]